MDVTKKRSAESSAPLAKRTDISNFARVKIFDETSHIDGTLASRFEVLDFLGSGAFGLVLLAKTRVTPDYNAVMSPSVDPRVMYAIKIEPLKTFTGTPDDLQERREKLGEILVYYAIHEAKIPRLNIAEAYFFMRMHSDDFFTPLPATVVRHLQVREVWKEIQKEKPTIFNITIMRNYTKGSLSALLADATYVARMKQNREMYVHTWLLMVTAGLHCLRQISGDLVHGDLHTGNILLREKNPVVTHGYVTGDGTAFVIPDLYTNNCIAVIADFGFASGEFTTADGIIPFQVTPSTKQQPDLQKCIISFMRKMQPEFGRLNAELFAVANRFRAAFDAIDSPPAAVLSVTNAIRVYDEFGPTAATYFTGQYDFELFGALSAFVNNMDQALGVLESATSDRRVKDKVAPAKRQLALIRTPQLDSDILFWQELVTVAHDADVFGADVYLELLKNNKIFQKFRYPLAEVQQRLTAANITFIPTKLELLAPAELASIKKRFSLYLSINTKSASVTKAQNPAAPV
jgi:serine/threonine protein kinase